MTRKTASPCEIGTPPTTRSSVANRAIGSSSGGLWRRVSSTTALGFSRAAASWSGFRSRASIALLMRSTVVMSPPSIDQDGGGHQLVRGEPVALVAQGDQRAEQVGIRVVRARRRDGGVEEGEQLRPGL